MKTKDYVITHLNILHGELQFSISTPRGYIEQSIDLASLNEEEEGVTIPKDTLEHLIQQNADSKGIIDYLLMAVRDSANPSLGKECIIAIRHYSDTITHTGIKESRWDDILGGKE